MKRIYTHIIALLCVLAILGMTLPAYAQQGNTLKEEVVYVNLNPDGTVDDTYVVNIFQLPQDGTIIDYGSYTSTRNMTSTDTIRQKGDQITIDTTQGEFYYQGMLPDAQIPWNINIQYFMNGIAYPADTIAGKSGAMEMRIHVRGDPMGDSRFLDAYTLQMTAMLDNKSCKNIVAEDATIANAGDNKQITYTILPGEEREVSLKADVTDFKMAGIQINGVAFNLGINIPDTDEMTDNITDLQTGISDLNDGADDLYDGAVSLQKGMDDIQRGADTLQEGLSQLHDQSPALTLASSKMRDGLNQINSSLDQMHITAASLEELTTGSTAVRDGIGALVDGIGAVQASFDAFYLGLQQNGIDRSAIQQGNTQTIASIGDQIQDLQDTITAMKALDPDADTSSLEEQIAFLTQTQTLLTANRALIDADGAFITQLDTGIDEFQSSLLVLQSQYQALDDAIQALPGTLHAIVDGMTALTEGVETLAGKYRYFDEGLHTYIDGVDQIMDGCDTLRAGITDAYTGVNAMTEAIATLKDGTDELREKTDTMDDDVRKAVDEMKEKIPDSNDDFDPVSFVSGKNTNIQSVQFLIKAPDIQTASPSYDEPADQIPQNFWEKLLSLFGIGGS